MDRRHEGYSFRFFFLFLFEGYLNNQYLAYFYNLMQKYKSILFNRNEWKRIGHTC